MSYKKKSTALHKKTKGKLEIGSRVPLRSKDDLSISYSPGVAGPSLEIARDESLYGELTSAGSTVAIISDGSSVLGLGNIGAKAAMPVMEGKAILMKKFAGLNAFPIVLDTQDSDEIVETIKNIAPSFAAINLEDIAAPKCFDIEKRLIKELGIPVMHDDQHGTAIVVLAGLINSLKIVEKKKENVKIVVNGVGAAGVAIIKLLHTYGFINIVACDSRGIIVSGRSNLNPVKKDLLKITNKENKKGDLLAALDGVDVFVGVSKGNILMEKHFQAMNADPIIFAMANPDPEVDPKLAKKWGAKIVATGRSDYPNQVNNVLVYPGIFKGAIQSGVEEITTKIKIKTAEALARTVKNPTVSKIIPSPFDKKVVENVSKAVKKITRGLSQIICGGEEDLLPQSIHSTARPFMLSFIRTIDSISSSR